MRRKRLEHQVHIFCHMFCGWRLTNDHELLTKKGSGRIEIDVLTGETTYKGIVEPDLHMTTEICVWFKEDIESNNIDISMIKRAVLIADLDIKPLVGKRKATERWNSPIREFMSCNIKCLGLIETDEKVYSSTLEDYEEWPVGWWNEYK